MIAHTVRIMLATDAPPGVSMLMRNSYSNVAIYKSSANMSLSIDVSVDILIQQIIYSTSFILRVSLDAYECLLLIIIVI